MADVMKKLASWINKTFPFMELPLSISRQGQFPLDKSSIWWSLEDAQTYAQSNPIAYAGQPLTVVNEDENTVTFYLIGTDGSLVPQGSEASVEELKEQLAAHKIEYNTLKQNHDQLKRDFDALKSAYDSHTHTADQITETATRVWVSPDQKAKIDAIVYATNADIDELFPELKA